MATIPDVKFLTKEDMENITAVGRKYDLKMILLHGSYANGTAIPESDLDIGILGRKPITAEELLKIHHDLSEVFGDNPQRELDLKSLHRADPLFCYQIAKNSRLLYGSSSDYSAFLAYAYSYYLDSKDLFRLEKTLIYKFQEYLKQKYNEHHVD